MLNKPHFQMIFPSNNKGVSFPAVIFFSWDSHMMSWLSRGCPSIIGIHGILLGFHRDFM